MSHAHSIIDSDIHFIIDPLTREIKNDSEKIRLIQHDHNSERFTFEIARFIEGHDMSLCNRVEVHYINVGNGETYSGLYKVDDLMVNPEDDEIVEFSWLISSNATQCVGALNFAIRFICANQDAIDYAWNTAPYSKITIANGIYVSDAVEEQYADVMIEWENRIQNLEITEDELFDALTETSMISAVADNDGSILTDENGKILLM